MRSMRYTDRRGTRQTLTFSQWCYLDKASKGGFEQGWGGMDNTLTARLLRERGLAELDDRAAHRPWKLTSATVLGNEVLEMWRVKSEKQQNA